ncbi:MAG: hypothetical protein MJY56_01200 [Bacteroidales bacterium]|nr:hypothetical protein [Bacteroidales bacterium]
MKESLRKPLKYVLTAVLFLVLAYGFVPQVLGGKIVNQSDISQWTGMTHETVEYNKANPDDETAWNGAMFSGMPTVAMYDDFDGDWTKPLYKLLLLGKRPATYLFVALLGAFLLMLSLGLGILPAIGGAIAVAFCSYNMQIIQVGHNTKMQAIAFLPWVLAALVFTYKSALREKKWLRRTVLGSALFALALSMQVKANHPQITWYLAGIILLYALTLFISLCVKDRKSLGKFFAASALLLAVGLVGIATNANKLIPTWEYAKYTMRGGSELSGDENKKGLDIDYATSWSYGIEETPNILIPNFNGGSSAGRLSAKSETAALLKKAGYRGHDLSSTLSAMPLYWGPQPFTAGPMYVGCISLFLFMLGLFLYKGKEKWWLLAASVLAVMLAWGSHMMWFTKLMMDCAPMYNKFRTVSMALIVLQVTVPMLGFMVLDRVLKGEYGFNEIRKPVMIAYAVTAGFCLLCALFPGIAGSFSGASDAQLPEALRETLAEDRASLLRSDALRSLVLITAAALVLHLFMMPKNRDGKFSATAACAVVCVLVLFDLFLVGKRYLGDGDFVTKKDFAARYTPRKVDGIILEDRSPSYRVADISTSTFNDAFPSYFHKSVGGYSPAKLQRYQDLIEKYLSKEINSIIKVVNDCKTVGEVQDKLPYCPVLSALNTRYLILGDDYAPVVNDWAYGTAWFVDNVVAASTPDEEIEFVGLVDLFEEAVVGKDFEWVWDEFTSKKEDFAAPVGDNDFVEMVSYTPKEVRYAYDVEKGKIAVFSEIYYPKGWKAYIVPDEKSILEGTGGESELELFRADWILRGAVIPAGSGEIVMRFEPESYRTGAAVSRASSIVLILLIVLSAGTMFMGRKEEEER